MLCGKSRPALGASGKFGLSCRRLGIGLAFQVTGRTGLVGGRILLFVFAILVVIQEGHTALF